MRLKPFPSPAAFLAVAGLDPQLGRDPPAGADPGAGYHTEDGKFDSDAPVGLPRPARQPAGPVDGTCISWMGNPDGALINALSKKPQGSGSVAEHGQRRRCPLPEFLDLEVNSTTKSARHPQRLTRTDFEASTSHL